MDGQVLDDRYRIERLIGSGGMAQVYLATDLGLDRKVAIKVLTQSPSPDTQYFRRFRREFKACARLSHPNIIKLFAMGTLPQGGLYYAMEYVPGAELAHLLKTKGPFPEDLVLTFLRQMASAFAHYHALGVVHRDLKPTNIMLVGDERFVLMDFGLARDVGGTKLTATGAVMGSPIYMSPELVTGKAADARSDLYQLGVIAYELLCGRRAFDATDLEAVLFRIIGDEPTPIASLVTGLRPGWDTFLALCMAKSPGDRFQDAESLLAACDELGRESFRQGDSTHLHPVAEGPSPHEDEVKTTTSRSPHLTLALAAVSLLLAAVALYLRGPGTPPGTFTVRGLRCRPGLESLDVTWSSDEPYPSRVQLLGPPSRVVEGLAAGPVTSHCVVINSLEEGRAYAYRLVYPSGETSLTKHARTSTFELTLEGVETTPQGVSLTFRSEPTGATRVLVLSGEGRGEAVEAEALKDGTSRVVLTHLTQATKEVTIETSLPSGGSKRVALSNLLEAEVRSLNYRLASFRPEELCRGVQAMLAPDGHELARTLGRLKQDIDQAAAARKDKAPAVRLLLRRRLRDTGLEECFQRAIALAPLVFETGLLDFGVRQPLHERLQRHRCYHLYARYLGASLGPVPLLPLGPWSLGLEPLKSDVHETSIFRSAGEPLKLGLHAPLVKLHFRPRWKTSFSLGSLDGVTAAELCFRCRRFMGNTMRVRLNNLPDIVTHDPWVSCEAGRRVPGEGLIYQRVPPEALVEGTNRLELLPEPLFGRYARTAVPILAVTLRLERSRR